MDEKVVKDSQGLVKDLVNDTISRQAAIEAIKEDKIDLTNTNVVAVFKATGDFEKVETQVMTCDRHIEILKDLPSAQPERKRGEWEFHEDRSPVWDIAGEKTWARAYKCSECGFAHAVIEDFGIYQYCPQCGADMREDEP